MLQKKQKKDKKSVSDEDADDCSDGGTKKVKSVLTTSVALPSSSSGTDYKYDANLNDCVFRYKASVSNRETLPFDRSTLR